MGRKVGIGKIENMETWRRKWGNIKKIRTVEIMEWGSIRKIGSVGNGKNMNLKLSEIKSLKNGKDDNRNKRGNIIGGQM